MKDRRARNLLRQFGGDTRIGNAWAVSRERLIEALQALRRGDDFAWDQRRRRRVADVLEQARREHPARQIEIHVAPETRFRTLGSLPAGIELRPGELNIRFSSFEDFLTKLFELGQAVQNDFSEFETFIQNRSTRT